MRRLTIIIICIFVMGAVLLNLYWNSTPDPIAESKRIADEMRKADMAANADQKDKVAATLQNLRNQKTTEDTLAWKKGEPENP